MKDYREMKFESWIGSKVKCDICSHEWIAVFRKDSEKLECPNCECYTNYEQINTTNNEN